jgi:DNA-binding CsgD family transcriptional regulator
VDGAKGWPLAGRDNEVGAFPSGQAQVGYGLCYALRAAGHLDEARQVADRGYADATAREAAGMIGVWAGFQGVVAKAQGRLADARRALREAIALVGDEDRHKIVRTWLAELAGAAALAGDTAAARDWMAHADAHPRTVSRLYDAWIELDRAWVLAVAGDLAAAAGTAQRAAKLARDSDQPAFAAIALYDAARLGGAPAVRAELGTLAAEVGGRVTPVFAAAATALSAGDGDALDGAAAAFAAHGHPLLAAEAAAAAAEAHHRAGHAPRGRASASRAGAFAAACPEVRTPLLRAIHAGPPLTPRERQVAALAVSRTSRQIAEQLGLSVHTVNNVLTRTYAKLGVSGRAGLAAALAPD